MRPFDADVVWPPVVRLVLESDDGGPQRHGREEGRTRGRGAAVGRTSWWLDDGRRLLAGR